jgi:GTP-binding protein Era
MLKNKKVEDHLMSEIKNVAMITVCGRPNVGKSSLTNALVGEKVAIVSNKAQTTRNRIYGVVNRDDTQYILMDTPGLHKPKSALGEYMVKVVTSSLSDVDCALLLVEPIAHVGAPELALIERVKEEGIPAILCINKIDTVEPAELLPVIAAYNEVWDGFDAIIPISAHSKNGLEELMTELRKYASEGPQLFPDGMTSDQPERLVMGELLREKLLLCLDKEIPHGTAIEITKFSERDSGVIDVDATIFCEKASHKGIIIGKQGAMLKKISTMARHDMEKFMGTKVYLETWVKVKENWRDNVNYVRSFGYNDD